MNWLNLEIKTLRAPEYVGAEPVQRATWLNLLAYCAEQENGGVLEKCDDWKDRRWMQTCGVMRSEVETDSDLWKWKGGNLIVWGYPKSKEKEVRAKREAGSRGGKATQNKPSRPNDQADGEAVLEAQLEAETEKVLEADGEAELQRKGKEGKEKGKEEERNLSTTTPAARVPARLEEVLAYADEQRKSDTTGKPVTDEIAVAWFDDRQAAGWVTRRDGHEYPIIDWRADLRKYARHWHQNPQAGAVSKPGGKGGMLAFPARQSAHSLRIRQEEVERELKRLRGSTFYDDEAHSQALRAVTELETELATIKDQLKVA